MVTKTEMAFFFVARGDFKATNFTSLMIQIIQKADHINTEKLKMGFPELVEVTNRYSNEEGYWEDLCNRVNEKENSDD